MSEDFFRFPRTPHLAWLGPGQPRDDKVLSPKEARDFLDGEVVVEEKLDGANLGISLDPAGKLRLQNRGAWLLPPYSGQFGRLQVWLDLHQDRLFDALEPHLIAFGEWCAARHSLDYDCLPDWWLLFDIWDRSAQRFWSCARRNAWAHRTGLSCVTELDRGHFQVGTLCQMLQRAHSRYRHGPPEGFVLRREDATWLHARTKLVRSEFMQQMHTHWRQRGLQWNRLDLGAHEG